MFNIEALQEILLSIIPPLHKEEYDYFHQEKIVAQYEKEKRYISSSYEFIDGEPELLFHEFIFTLGKIALTTVTVTDAETLTDKLKVLFVERLRFPEISDPYEHIEKYLLGDHEQEDSLYSSDEDLDGEGFGSHHARNQDLYEDDPQQMLHDFIERRAEKDENFVIDYENVLNELNAALPPVPPKPKVQQLNPPPYAIPREKFGKLLPKVPVDDKDKKKKKPAPKRPKPKKDEKPKKIYPFEQYPRVADPPSNLLHINDFKKDMSEPVFHKNFKETECNPGVAPCIIKEVFIPPEAPQEIATLIESALVYQNTANYEMSLATFEEARQLWRETLNVTALRAEVELFFELSLGSVYESAGRDELALAKYLSAKEIKLVYNHPDHAFPYCGLGSVLYHMEEPVWALRAYCKAREIREERLGGDTVDTATVYNNLGCCMMALERFQEAQAYFELSAAILEVELGAHHERTLTAGRNILKSKRTVLNITPEYRPLWSFAARAPGPVLGKKKKKKKGKKKKK